jgi:hypothetical protein
MARVTPEHHPERVDVSANDVASFVQLAIARQKKRVSVGFQIAGVPRINLRLTIFGVRGSKNFSSRFA